jgi:hypothetical protein
METMPNKHQGNIELPEAQREAMEAVSIGTVLVMEQEQTASASK